MVLSREFKGSTQAGKTICPCILQHDSLRGTRFYTPMQRSLLASLLLFCFCSCELSAAEGSPEKIDIFTANTLGYKIYHIPGIVVTAKGTVLAWCEARKKGGDWDSIDVLMRRSFDNGKTFSEPVKISEAPEGVTKNPFSLGVKGVDPKDVTCNNPVFIADKDGTVHGLYCIEYMRCFYIQIGRASCRERV